MIDMHLRRLARPLIAGVAFLCLSGIPWAKAVVAQTTDPVVAKIGSIQLTEFDIQREVQKRLPMQVSFHGGLSPEKLEVIRQQARNALFERAYKVQYAIDNEIAIGPNVLETEWSAMLGNSRKLAEAAKQGGNPQVEAIRASLYFDLLAKAAEDKAVNQKVVVKDEEAQGYYQANKQKYFQPKLYKASHILIKIDPTENKESQDQKEKKAKAILSRAKNGEDFYNLAYYESDDRSKYVGGSLGSFHEGQTVGEFEEAIKKMKPGEISGLVRTLYGYHIIKVDDVQPERQLSYEEAENLVKKLLAEQQRKKYYDQWMSFLRDKYPLQNYEK